MILIKKDEKTTTNFELTDDTDLINKASLDEKLLKTNGHLSLLEKTNNDTSLNYNKQSVEEFSIQRAVKTTIQKLYEKSLFAGFPNADSALKNLLQEGAFQRK